MLWQSFLSSFSPFRKPSVFALHDSRHVFEISDDSRMRINFNDLPMSMTKKRADDF